MYYLENHHPENRCARLLSGFYTFVGDSFELRYYAPSTSINAFYCVQIWSLALYARAQLHCNFSSSHSSNKAGKARFARFIFFGVKAKRVTRGADLSLHKSAEPLLPLQESSEYVCQKASGNTQKNLHHSQVALRGASLFPLTLLVRM